MDLMSELFDNDINAEGRTSDSKTESKGELKDSRKRTIDDAFGSDVNTSFPKKPKTRVNDEKQAEEDGGDDDDLGMGGNGMLGQSMFADVHNRVEDNSENYDEKMMLSVMYSKTIRSAIMHILNVPYMSDDAFVIFEFQEGGVVISANSTRTFVQFTLAKDYLGDNFLAVKTSVYYIGVKNAKAVFKSDAKHMKIFQNAELCVCQDMKQEATYEPGSTLIVELECAHGEKDRTVKTRTLISTSSNTLENNCMLNNELREKYNEILKLVERRTPVSFDSKTLSNMFLSEQKDKTSTIKMTLKKVRNSYKILIRKTTLDQSCFQNLHDVFDDQIHEKFPKDSNGFIVYQLSLSDLSHFKQADKISDNVDVYFLQEGLLLKYHPIESEPTVLHSMYIQSNPVMQ